MRGVTVDDIADFAAVTGRGRKKLVADLFCGAGGFSEGIDRAMGRLGLDYELVCVNHWPTAIETHSLNHRKARHYCQDIATVRPHLVCPEGHLDLLTGSPTCTHHSVARGGKPTSDQQRSDPWHLISWFTELRVSRAIIENVWEYVKWGPIDPATMRPIKQRAGEYHKAWIDTIWKLGATSIEWRKLNSANYGGATTRERYFAFIRFDGKPLLWPVITHAKKPAADSGLKRWKPAREIIDWTIRGKSIFTRPVPLAPKTLARILAGAIKFGWPDVFYVRISAEVERSLIHAIRYSFARRHVARADLRKRHRARVTQYVGWLRRLRGEEVGAAAAGDRRLSPMLVILRQNADGRSIELPAPALAANGTHVAIAEPIIINGRKNNKAKIVSREPVPTLDTKGGVWLAEPFVLSTGSGAPRSVSNPMPTATTGGAGSDDPGCARPLLVEPMVVNLKGQSTASDIDRPLPTQTAHAGHLYMAEPFMLSRHGDGAARSAGDPTPTQVAKHSHILIAPYYGSGSGETCTSAETPLPAATSKARFAMVVPLTHSDGSNRARDVEVDPLATLTTAHRGELAFITAQFGEREGQTPRTHSLDAPAPAVCASGHVDLVEGEVIAAEQVDVLFRMLEAHELAGAMGFNRAGRAYVFAGTKTEQVKQIGNAVSVEQAEANVYAMFLDEVEPAADFLEAAE